MQTSRSQAFLLELAGQQARVGGVLALGARLAGGGALCAGEAREVRLQRRLLAARWEQLRRRALRRQAAGHAALMRAQRAARDAFRYRPTRFRIRFEMSDDSDAIFQPSGGNVEALGL